MFTVVNTMSNILNLYVTNKRIVLIAFTLLVAALMLTALLIPYGVAQAGPATSGGYCGC